MHLAIIQHHPVFWLPIGSLCKPLFLPGLSFLCKHAQGKTRQDELICKERKIRPIPYACPPKRSEQRRVRSTLSSSQRGETRQRGDPRRASLFAGPNCTAICRPETTKEMISDKNNNKSERHPSTPVLASCPSKTRCCH